MNKFNTLTDAEKQKVKSALYGLFFNEIVSFSFKKKDGTLRESFGCLDEQVLEQNNALPKQKSQDENTEKKPIPLNLFKYFDTEKKAWRSFNLDTLNEVFQVKFDDYIDKVLSE